MAALAIIGAGLFLAIDLRQRGYDPSSSLEIVFAGGIGGFIGARLYYVAEHWGEPGEGLFTSSGLVWYGGVAGGVIGYFALGNMTDVLPFVLVFAAASFIYIAVADLIPWMQRRVDTESSAWQIAMVGSGVGFIALTHSFLH